MEDPQGAEREDRSVRSSAEEDVGSRGVHATLAAPVFGDIGRRRAQPRGPERLVAARWAARPVPCRRDDSVHLVLDHDGFAKEQPVTVADDLSRVQFVLENRGGGAHATGLSVAGLPAGDYAVSVDGR